MNPEQKRGSIQKQVDVHYCRSVPWAAARGARPASHSGGLAIVQKSKFERLNGRARDSKRHIKFHAISNNTVPTHTISAAMWASGTRSIRTIAPVIHDPPKVPSAWRLGYDGAVSSVY